jgi:O-antigen ligase
MAASSTSRGLSDRTPYVSNATIGTTHVIERLVIRAVWLSGAALAAVCLLSIYYQPVGWGPPLIVTALALLAAFRPYVALLVAAGVGPLGAVVLGATRAEPIALHFYEGLTLAFLLGFALRRVARPRRLRIAAAIAWSAALLMTIPLASAMVSAAAFRVERFDRSVFALVRTGILNTYLVDSNPFTITMLFVEGVVLAIVVADVCAGDHRRREHVLALMIAGTSVAAAFNVAKILVAALRHDNPWHTFLVYFATVRVNVHFADLNAAGSYFSLMFLAALGYVRRSRFPAIVACTVLAAALWIAGSRAALAATLVVAACGAALALRSRRHGKAAIIGVVSVAIGIAAAGWIWYPEGRNLGSVEAGAYRLRLAKIALDMMAANPLFGIGAGQFFAQSGQAENVHNNFLQIGAEFGIAALLLLLLLLAFAIRALWGTRDRSAPMWGLTGGLMAFLLTCLVGHPLLVAPAAYPFWIGLGLAISTAVATPLGPAARRACIAIVVALLAVTPFRIIAAIRHADVEHTSSGFSAWQRDATGSPFRWAGSRATFFVASSARAIRIPLGRGPAAPPMVEVRLFLDGVEADRVILQGDDSRIVRLVLARRTDARFVRIDLDAAAPGAASLKVEPTASNGVLAVGRPTIEE